MLEVGVAVGNELTARLFQTHFSAAPARTTSTLPSGAPLGKARSMPAGRMMHAGS
jgi:hypothetical protein